MSTQVKVLYFAAARDVTQITEEVLVLPENKPTLRDLTMKLVDKYGDYLEKILDQSMYAINMEYVDKESKIYSGDEIAVIPPVSGG
ncbi:hypothetical protein VTP01DRAFT_6974 [Rhizomucor pusillus]|uniref:uncharacterized protein n=1 Tax=Rhizomucor pusillus TaxID=4840 RepID=UPI00374477A0